MELLLAAGFKKDQMRLVIARDLIRNADHALLIVTLSSGAFVLDNATNSLLDARLANDYRPIMSFSEDRKWLHGYAVEKPAEAPAMQIAMLSVPSTPLTLP
jgi:predicted transglutaminase-like cysteine proteinase